MQYSALLLLTVAATTVTANLQPAARPLAYGVVAARQDDGEGDNGEGDDSDSDDSSSCASELAALSSGMPTLPADLASATITTATDGCAILPSSFMSEWNDFASSQDSWYTSASAELDDLLSTCTDYSSFAVSITRPCVNADVASATATPTTSRGSASSPSATAGAAAHRDVGVVGAVLAGALGAAIAL